MSCPSRNCALYEYAMSFVKRNKGDLMETLFAINLTLFRDYDTCRRTTVDTTPFEVMVQRCGVCQDFSNLFITMARLLGIPARYVCGYIFTGNNSGPALRMPATRGFSFTSPTSAGKVSIRPTASCRRTITSASPTAGIISTRHRPKAPSSARRPKR